MRKYSWSCNMPHNDLKLHLIGHWLVSGDQVQIMSSWMKFTLYIVHTYQRSLDCLGICCLKITQNHINSISFLNWHWSYCAWACTAGLCRNSLNNQNYRFNQSRTYKKWSYMKTSNTGGQKKRLTNNLITHFLQLQWIKPPAYSSSSLNMSPYKNRKQWKCQFISLSVWKMWDTSKI